MTLRKRRLPFLLLSLLGIAVEFFEVVEPARAQNRVRAAYSSISGIFTPVWLAADEGLFSKNKLDGDLVFIGGSPVAIGALLTGEIDFLAGGADPVVGAILSGAELVVVGFISNTTPLSLYVAPGINRVEELKGKTAAVTRLASSSAYMMKVCLGQARMDVKDVGLLQSGGYTESFAALHAGRVQAAILSPPTTYRAEAAGYKKIWNGSGVEYPSLVLATRKSFLKDPGDRAFRFFHAIAEGIQLFKTDKERAIKVMAKYTKVRDRAILDSTYADNREVHSQTMRPTVSGVKTILDILAANNPKATSAKGEQFFDESLSRRLEESGGVRKDKG
jgi:ABC-type nitrate/sulfonate/bicarbonate transport system substrate-binding protein